MLFFKIGFYIFFTILFLTLDTFAVSAKGTSDTEFQQGIKAFEKGEYRKAVDFFEAAQKDGLNSSALHYNLGVSYYKLKYYREARKEFELLAKEKDQAPLAHYNLGLIALRIGDKSEAAEHFQITARTAPDEKLRGLARAQLKGFTLQKRKIWSGFFSIAAGYDDNVNLNVDNTVVVSDIRDEFVEFIGGGTAQLAGTRNNGLQLGGTIYSHRYRDVKEFNFDSLRIGPEIDRRIGAWDTTLRGFADWAFIDGDHFESILNAEVGGRRDISPNLNLRLRYRFSSIDASSVYESQSGTRHRFNTEIRTNIFNTYAGSGYTLELNNRDDASFPTRHSIYAFTDLDFKNAWHTEMEAQYRYSNYKNIDRDDGRLWLTFKLSREIPWKLRLFGKYDFIRNSSNVAQRDYTSNNFSIGIERFF